MPLSTRSTRFSARSPRSFLTTSSAPCSLPPPTTLIASASPTRPRSGVAAMSDLHTTTENVLIDERVRGFPPGNPPLALAAIGKQGWKPYDGRMALPLISLDRQAFSNNVELMMAYVKSHGADIAPHAKTPMSTALSDALLA